MVAGGGTIATSCPCARRKVDQTSPSSVGRAPLDKDVRAAADVVVDRNGHVRDEVVRPFVPAVVEQGENAPELLADAGPVARRGFDRASG